MGKYTIVKNYILEIRPLSGTQMLIQGTKHHEENQFRNLNHMGVV